MFIVCANKSYPLKVEGKVLFYSSAKERREAKSFYSNYGFTVG